MNKTTRYETAANNCIPRLRYHIMLNSGGGQQKETLSEKEETLKKLLSKAKAETLIGISIRTRLQCRSVGGFREMIKELYEQSLVAKNELIRAIGSDAVALIETLS